MTNATIAALLVFGSAQASESLSPKFVDVLLKSLNTIHGFNNSNPNTNISCSAGIPNGIKTDLFPAVIQLKVTAPVEGSCTGTLIGDGTILTAGHCLDCKNGKNRYTAVDFEVDGKKISMKSAICNPEYDSDLKATNRNAANDLAIVLFDARDLQKPIDYPLLVTKTDPKLAYLHEKVTLVGYGMNNPNGTFIKGAGYKRAGTTYIENTGYALLSIEGHFRTPGVSIFNREGDPTGEDVGASFGDSGGPMISGNGALYGVLSMGGELNWDSTFLKEESIYCLLSSPLSRRFLEDAKKLGAKFSTR